MTLTLKSAARKDRAQPTTARFQHAHFAEIARIIRETPGPMLRMDMADRFADELSRTNTRFDVTRFKCACIPTGE